jgi:CheY-like chemotaxis protein
MTLVGTMVALTAPRPLPLALIAVHESDSRSMYGESLKLANWSVEEATDGREALALALAQRPDLIVADSWLPGISGYELCHILRHDLATRLTPIVMVTSDAIVRDLERAKSSGASSVLVKPCLPETLIAEANKLLEHSRESRDRSAGARHKTSDRLAHSGQPIEKPRVATRNMSRTHQRGKTVLPPAAPPNLRCPGCDRMLIYQSSNVGGVSARNAEQWDYFTCTNSCGTFQYRHRTRKLRRV